MWEPSIGNQRIHKNKVNKFLSLKVALELLIMIICPNPFFDFFIPANRHLDDINLEYFFNDILLSLMFLKIIFVLRYIENHSMFTNAYSKMICKKYNFTAGIRFALRCHFELYPGVSIFLMFVITIVVQSYLIRIYELPFYLLTDYDEGKHFFN